MLASTASTSSRSGTNHPGSVDYIDLKVTNQELNLVEWSFRRNEIPDALARRGITWKEWKAVFDQCDMLWRRRSRELHEIDEERNRYFLRNPAIGQIVTSIWAILFALLFFGGMILLAIMSGWLLCLGITLMMATTDHTVYFPKYFDAMANYEKDWSQLADDQRRVFRSLADVTVEQVQEIVVVHGRKPTWTVGLRFRFEDPISEQNGTGTTVDGNDAVHDLERLLELHQNGAPGTVQQEEEYQRIKTRLIMKLSYHPNAARPSSPHDVVTAMAMVVTDDENNNHHEGYYEKKRLLEMV
jgi:hypothetical protein